MRNMLIILFVPAFVGLVVVASPVFAGTYVVRPDGAGDFPTIQAAINAVSDGDTVELADGTFTGIGNRGIDYLGKAIVVRSQSGDPDSCIIDCQSAERGFHFHAGERMGSVLDGLTITNGSTIGDGGAVCCNNNSSPLLTDCKFINNSADDDGGGVGCNSSSPCLTNCDFINNSVGDSHGHNGGGIACENSSSPSLTSCTFSNNYGYGGGAIRCWSSSPDFTDCVIDGNSAGWGGGAHLDGGSAPSFTKCTFSGNSASESGAGICSRDNSSPVLNSSIVAFSSGEGVWFINSGSDEIEYCDFYENSGGDVVGYNPPSFGVLVDTNANGDPCDIYHNIFLDPLFVDAAAGDFHLQAGSPCIDAGDPSLPLDPDCTVAEIGAFYFSHASFFVMPESLHFGLLDLGTDSSATLALYNPTACPVAIDTISHDVPDFVADTTGLGGQVDPQETYYMTVTFVPSVVGVYIDTLVIIAQQVGDDTICIPLSGEADVIPMPVDSLVIQRGPLNGIQLNWAPVTQSISGQPLPSVSYIIYGATSSQGAFVPFGFATDTSYVHPYILNSQSIYFYEVTVFPGTLAPEKMDELFGRAIKNRKFNE